MKQHPLRWLTVLSLLTLFFVFACADDDDSVSIDPHLFEDSFQIDPNPVDLYETATFYLAWEDHDGDFDEPTVTVRLVTEDDVTTMIPIENLEVEGTTGGSLSFEVEILDEYQGEYSVIVRDEDGNVSNEVTEYLYVNQSAGEEGED